MFQVTTKNLFLENWQCRLMSIEQAGVAEWRQTIYFWKVKQREASVFSAYVMNTVTFGAEFMVL